MHTLLYNQCTRRRFVYVCRPHPQGEEKPSIALTGPAASAANAWSGYHFKASLWAEDATTVLGVVYHATDANNYEVPRVRALSSPPLMLSLTRQRHHDAHCTSYTATSFVHSASELRVIVCRRCILI